MSAICTTIKRASVSKLKPWDLYVAVQNGTSYTSGTKNWLQHLHYFVPEILERHQTLDQSRSPNLFATSVDGLCGTHIIANTFASQVSDYLNTHDPTPQDALSSLTSNIGT